ncbi:MAG: hypothetical protein PHD91_05265 [bacterium]|jgi:hypothetical protein|nr:hypothetical protein [bacterium]MDD4153106.1 hypothetical protein [bacterium]
MRCKAACMLSILFMLYIRTSAAQVSALGNIPRENTETILTVPEDCFGSEPYKAENFYFKIYVMPEVSLGEAAIEVVGKSGPFFGIDYIYTYLGILDGSVVFTPAVLTPPSVAVTDIYLPFKAGGRFRIAIPSLSDYSVPSLGGYGYASITIISLSEDMRIRLGRPTDLQLPAGIYEKSSEAGKESPPTCPCLLLYQAVGRHFPFSLRRLGTRSS